MQMTREVAREEWQRYFDELVASDRLTATLEIVGPELGDQTAAQQMPLGSVSYDDETDSITIAVGGRGERFPVVLWHTIEQPRRVHVLEQSGVANAILIEDEADVRTLVRISTGDHAGSAADA